MDINVKIGGKFKNISMTKVNIEDINMHEEDNILKVDSCNVELPGGLTIKTFEVTYNAQSYYLEKEFIFETPFSNQCIAVAGGAISNSDRNCLIVNSTPKTNKSCLVSVRHVDKTIIGNVTLKMIAIGY